MSYRFLSEDQLLAQCRVEHYRGSGPGGQKRNKTSNAVRLKHEETGLIVTATEARSAKENHLFAVRRMRLKLVAEIREAIELLHFEPPDWFLSIRHEGHIDVSHRHEFYAATGGLILDLLAACRGTPSDVAANLGVNTTAVIRILENEPVWWTKANEIRASLSLPKLSHRS
jgi:hypothetical protein